MQLDLLHEVRAQALRVQAVLDGQYLYLSNAVIRGSRVRLQDNDGEGL